MSIPCCLWQGTWASSRLGGRCPQLASPLPSSPSEVPLLCPSLHLLLLPSLPLCFLFPKSLPHLLPSSSGVKSLSGPGKLGGVSGCLPAPTLSSVHGGAPSCSAQGSVSSLLPLCLSTCILGCSSQVSSRRGSLGCWNPQVLVSKQDFEVRRDSWEFKRPLGIQISESLIFRMETLEVILTQSLS